MLDQLASADFTPRLGQPFAVQLAGVAPVELTLAAVEELGPADGAAGRRPFSLLFLGPVSRQYFLQRTYRLEHAELGAIDMFLVPLGPEGGRMRYEAVFT